MESSVDGKRFAFILVTLIFIAFAASGLWFDFKPAAASAIPPNAARLEAAPTATPPSGSADRATGVSPVVGILVLLAPLVYLVWKSRGLKEPKITAVSCLPVIDENKRPFKVEEDDQEPG